MGVFDNAADHDPLDSDMKAEARPPVTHLVVVSEPHNKKLRMFHMHEIPTTLMKRALTPNTARYSTLFSKGLTCRVVKLNGLNGHIFGGNTGRDQQIVFSGVLEMPKFSEIYEHRSETEIAEHSGGWEHVGGKPPTVSQWLAGVGQTEQVPINERPEIPKESKRLLAPGASNDLTRPRIPQGGQLLVEESDGDDTDAGHGSHRANFQALLSSTKNNTADDTASDMSSSDTSDDMTAPRKFRSLMGQENQMAGTVKRRVSLDWRTALPPTASLSRQDLYSSRVSETVKSENTKTSQYELKQAAEKSTSNVGFQDYGKTYSNVDNIGLSSTAKNAAQWEEMNYLDQRSPRRALPVIARRTEKSLSTLNTPTHSSRGKVMEEQNVQARTPSATTSFIAPTITTWQSHRSENPQGTWSRRVVKPSPESNSRLIDGTETYSGSPVPVPPGLQPLKQNTGNKDRSHTSQVSNPFAVSGNLLDLTENVLEASPSRKRDSAQGRRKQTTLVPGTPTRRSETSHTANEPDEKPIERLKIIPAAFSETRNTMNQKAIMKYATAPQTQSPASNSAALSNQQSPGGRSRRRGEREKNTFTASMLTTPPVQSALGIQDKKHSFGQLLCNEIQSNELYADEYSEEDEFTATSMRLTSQVGLSLLRTGESLFGKRVLDCKSMEGKLNDPSAACKTDFLPRLTTSDVDAKYVIELAGGNVDSFTSECIFELQIRDAGGSVLKVAVPTASKTDFKTTRPNKLVAEAFAHYPAHVYDARYQLTRSASEQSSPSRESITYFVSSMTTDGTVPSFKAKIQPGTIVVERVFSKQIFRKNINGVVFEVCRTCDMLLEFVDSVVHNFRAAVASEAEMLEHQRIWWEANWETSDLNKAGELQRQVDEVVRGIDGVGLSNVGPWTHNGNWKATKAIRHSDDKEVPNAKRSDDDDDGTDDERW